MPTAQIQLLGNFQFSLDNRVVLDRIDVRQQALIAYLTLHHDIPIDRRDLGHYLWPDTSLTDALTALNHLLDDLSRTLSALPHLLRLTPETVQWHSDAACRLDVADFEEAIASAEAAEQTGDTETVREQLLQATQHYRGLLLPHCSEDWINDERSRMHALYINSLTRLVPLLEQEDSFALAANFARVLRQNSLHYENLHRRLAHMHVLSGSRAGLLQKLEQRMEETVRGQGVLILIQGVAGMG
ncbi:MAG: hypothetical protein KDE53_07150, partial [Caldilineaceae bacterium]|nr:hypothetical protein [Caldilineaceae bacterium]